MDRYNFKEYISAYIDGDLSIDEKKEFEDIMNSHSECKIKFEEVKSLIENLNQAPQAKTSADFMDKLHARIDSHNQTKETILDKISNFLLGPKMRPAYGFAMSIAVFFVVLTVLRQPDLSLADSENKSLFKAEKYSNEEIAYQEVEDEEDTTNINANIPIKLVRGEKSSDQGDEWFFISFLFIIKYMLD